MDDAGRANLPSSRSVSGHVRAVWAAVGDAFFRELVNHLSTVLAADLVYVCEHRRKPADRMIILASSTGSGVDAPADYDLAGTAAEETLSLGMSIRLGGVRSAFPTDAVLKNAGAEALAAKALFDSLGRPIGAIIALWTHPLEDAQRPRAILEAFAPRAAAELERKRIEDSIAESEERYRAFISKNADGMWRIEFQEPIPTDSPEDEQLESVLRLGYLAECNEAAVRIYFGEQHSISSVVGYRLKDIVERLGTTDELREMIRSGYKTEHCAVTLGTDGRKYIVRTIFGIVENGKLLRFWGTARDIGDLRNAELEWHAWEGRFRTLLESIHVAAVMLDTQGRIVFCNEFLLHITGWSRDELVGKDWFELVVPPEHRDTLRPAFLRYLSEGKDHDPYEGVIQTRSGTRRLIDWDRTILRDTENNIIGTAGIGRDVTLQRMLEARLREADKLESVRRLAGAIAHDFGNMLTAISGYGSQLLEAHQGGPERLAAEQVLKASEQGAALTRQLIAFSRDMPVKRRVVDLNGVVTDSRTMLEHLAGKAVKLVLDLAPSLPAVLADPGEMHQVLVNLTINARDAMPRGGCLTITTRVTGTKDEAPAEIRDVEPGMYVQVDVADTGTGIPEDVRMHVFEPFFTTKEGRGTGLGLASVYGIVRENRGYISLKSEVGKGTTFRILLPVLP